MLTGSYSHTIDAKNRLFIPAKHREKLGSNFVITRNVDKCLSIYSMEEWEKFSAKLEALPNIQSRNIVRFVYANACDVQPDAQGRVVLSPELVAYAGLQKNVTIIGCNNHAEIWDEELWKQKNNEDDAADLLQQMVELGL